MLCSGTTVGTRIAIFMVKKCNVKHNIVNDSVAEAIYVSTPCKDLHICSNTLHNSHGAGIKIAEQLDHNYEEAEDSINNTYKIALLHNHITNKALPVRDFALNDYEPTFDPDSSTTAHVRKSIFGLQIYSD